MGWVRFFKRGYGNTRFRFNSREFLTEVAIYKYQFSGRYFIETVVSRGTAACWRQKGNSLRQFGFYVGLFPLFVAVAGYAKGIECTNGLQSQTVQGIAVKGGKALFQRIKFLLYFIS